MTWETTYSEAGIQQIIYDTRRNIARVLGDDIDKKWRNVHTVLLPASGAHFRVSAKGRRDEVVFSKQGGKMVYKIRENDNKTGRQLYIDH